LCPALLALAIGLNLAELVMRKWKGILEAFGVHPRTAEA
jgi:hypothetical protein